MDLLSRLALTSEQTGQFTAEQLPTIIKASEAALEATKALKPIEPAITSALKEAGGEGLVDLVNKAKSALGPIDLSSRFGEEGIQSALAKTGKFTEDQLGELVKAVETNRTIYRRAVAYNCQGQRSRT